MDTCQCEDFHWTCSPNEEVTGPTRWITNTTDVLFDVGDFNINEWILQTHHDFIRTRFGGWSSAFQHNGEGKVIDIVDILRSSQFSQSSRSYWSSRTSRSSQSFMSSHTSPVPSSSFLVTLSFFLIFMSLFSF